MIFWNSLAWQSASIAGPALGGFLVAMSPGLSYGVALALYVAAAISVATRLRSLYCLGCELGHRSLNRSHIIARIVGDRCGL